MSINAASQTEDESVPETDAIVDSEASEVPSNGGSPLAKSGESESKQPHNRFASLTADRVRSVLEKHSGNIPAAAIDLGIRRDQLYRYISITPSLADLKPKGNQTMAIISADVVDRDEAASALVESGGDFDAALKRLGISDKRQHKINALVNLTDHHMKETLQLMHGSMAESVMSMVEEREKLQELVCSLLEKLRDENEYPAGSKERANLRKELALMSTLLRQLDAQITKNNEVTHHSALLNAMLKQKEKKTKFGYDKSE